MFGIVRGLMRFACGSPDAISDGKLLGVEHLGESGCGGLPPLGVANAGPLFGPRRATAGTFGKAVSVAINVRLQDGRMHTVYLSPTNARVPLTTEAELEIVIGMGC
ncbi:MAG: hypothetical protein ACR2F6_05845 [Mycobacteriales bacterium]